MKRVIVLLSVLGGVAGAQDALTLKDAVALALGQNQSLHVASAATRAAEARIEQARGGFLPKLNYSESFARSNNPVFVFSSLLTQHRFTERNFAIGPLNRPGFLNNFQSQLVAEQVIYDAGQIKGAEKAARLGANIAGEDGRRVRMEVIAGVVRAYYGAVLGAESLKAATEAVRSAEADLRRAEAVRAAGMSTDADVLSIRVHLASVKEQQFRRQADLDVARAAINEVIGLPLDAPHALTTPLERAAIPEGELAAFESKAVDERPEARQTRFGTSLARVQTDTARGSLLPQVGFRAAFEANRERFIDNGGANWLAAVSLKWNLFNGFTDRARIAEAGYALRRAEADEKRTASGIKLQVRRAWADLRSAEQRIEVARAAMAEAEESLRITKDRYEAGLATVTDLLRTETAQLDSRTRFLAAVHDQRVAAVMLELAAGTLSPESEVLR